MLSQPGRGCSRPSDRAGPRSPSTSSRPRAAPQDSTVQRAPSSSPSPPPPTWKNIKPPQNFCNNLVRIAPLWVCANKLKQHKERENTYSRPAGVTTSPGAASSDFGQGDVTANVILVAFFFFFFLSFLRSLKTAGSPSPRRVPEAPENSGFGQETSQAQSARDSRYLQTRSSPSSFKFHQKKEGRKRKK